MTKHREIRADSGAPLATRELRIDQGVRFTATIDPISGYLRTDARLTRVGVFEYRLMDGTKRRELRPSEEVFRPASLESLRMVPVCDDHPTEPVSSANASAYARGSISDSVQQDGIFVAAGIAIWDSRLIAKAQDGKQELSCGYTCDVEFTPGIFDGIEYDAVQRNILYNHVAVVQQGRAGPAVRMRLDSGEIELQPGELAEMQPKGDDMDLELINAMLGVLGLDPIKDRNDGVSIDGKRFKANTKEEIAALKQAMDDFMKKQKEALKAAKEGKESKGDALELIAKKDQRIDDLEAELEQAKKELETAKKDGAPEAVQKRANERSELVAFAAKIAPTVKADGLTNDQLMAEVLIARAPEAKRDSLKKKFADEGAVYVKSRFDSLRESEENRVDNGKPLASAVLAARGINTEGNNNNNGQRVDTAQARQNYIAELTKPRDTGKK